jgi:hypothetical protein
MISVRGVLMDGFHAGKTKKRNVLDAKQLQNQKRELAAAALSGEAVKNMNLDMNDLMGESPILCSCLDLLLLFVVWKGPSRRSFAFPTVLWGPHNHLWSRVALFPDRHLLLPPHPVPRHSPNRPTTLVIVIRSLSCSVRSSEPFQNFLTRGHSALPFPSTPHSREMMPNTHLHLCFGTELFRRNPRHDEGD